MIDLDEIEARANSATPGPWTYHDGCGYVEVPPGGAIEFKPGWERSVHFLARVHNNHVEGEDGLGFDGAFIAAARTDVPALIARVRELEAEQAEAHAAWEQTGIHTDGTRDLADALGIREGKMTADGVARSALQRVRELEAECERQSTLAATTFNALIANDIAQMREYGLSYEGVRKVLHEYNDGEISFGKLMDLIRAAARAMAEDQLSGKTGGLP